MKTDKRIRLMFLIVVAPILMLSRCTSVTGGGEIGNPITLEGRVVDKNNRGVPDMRISLVSFDEFNPVAASLSNTAGKSYETTHPVAETVTDTAGMYVFSVTLNQKRYTLFGQAPDRTGQRKRDAQGTDSVIMIYHPFVPFSQAKSISLIDTAFAAGTVIIGITDSLFKPDLYVFMYGTPLFGKIEGIGRKSLRCPSGLTSFAYYSAGQDSVIMTIPPIPPFWDDRISGIYTKTGTTIDISGLVHRISKPQRPSGNTQVEFEKQGNGNLFVTGNAMSNLADTVQYRLSWGDSSRSPWISPQGSPLVASVNVFLPSTGTYTLRAQARSIQDTNVVSPFSDTLTVTVR
jgi:hypothetical protein